MEEPWEGPIYLPTSERRAPELVFFGRFRGTVEVSPFIADDTFRITGADRQPSEWSGVSPKPAPTMEQE